MKYNSTKVTVGMPLRNGGLQLKNAIETILNQTEKNLQIIISDNGSTDGSSKYLKNIAKKDSRIEYYYQKNFLTAFDNFMFVLSKAESKFFLWAAHDDTRSYDYIEKLYNALETNPEMILVFSDVYKITESNQIGTLMNFDFSTSNLSLKKRIKKTSQIQCFHIYGLWRTSMLKSIPKKFCNWGADLPIMIGGSLLGIYGYVNGPRFNYYEVVKTSAERAKLQDNSKNFNLIVAVLQLLQTVFYLCYKINGIIIAFYATSLVFQKQLFQFPGFLYRKLLKWLK